MWYIFMVFRLKFGCGVWVCLSFGIIRIFSNVQTKERNKNESEIRTDTLENV